MCYISKNTSLCVQQWTEKGWWWWLHWKVILKIYILSCTLFIYFPAADITPSKRTTRKTSVKEAVEATDEKPATPSRRSTRIKSNTSIVSETTQSYDSPRAKRAARRTSQVGQYNDVITPINIKTSCIALSSVVVIFMCSQRNVYTFLDCRLSYYTWDTS